MTPEVWIALITAVSAIAVAWLGRNKLKKADRIKQSAQKIVSRHAKAFDFAQCAEDWGALLKELDTLFETTVVDRFLILRAWNGSIDPVWTTAIFQYRHGAQEPSSYVSFELDDDYVHRIKKIVKDRSLYFRVDEQADCAIKKVYEMEGVRFSYWSFIGRETFEDGTASITYCSFATHEPVGMCDKTRTKCSIISYMLSGMDRSFKEKQS